MILTGYIYNTIDRHGKEVEWSGLFRSLDAAIAWFKANVAFWRARNYPLLLKEVRYNNYARFISKKGGAHNYTNPVIPCKPIRDSIKE